MKSFLVTSSNVDPEGNITHVNEPFFSLSLSPEGKLTAGGKSPELLDYLPASGPVDVSKLTPEQASLYFAAQAERNWGSYMTVSLRGVSEDEVLNEVSKITPEWLDSLPEAPNDAAPMAKRLRPHV
jgi:hypothetical protein